MSGTKRFNVFAASILILSLTACSVISTQSGNAELQLSTVVTGGEITSTVAPEPVETSAHASENQDQSRLDETDVVFLKLPERISSASFEYSGLAWFKDQLVLLPQYPGGKFFSYSPVLYSISKQDILTAIENPELELPARDVPLLQADIQGQIQGFEGFESILFVGQQVFLTIETHGGDPMMGYLIRGEVNGDLERITLEPDSLVELPPLTHEQNATFEALTSWNDKLNVIYEHNSGQAEMTPIAYEFNLDMEFSRKIPFPAINYRITDATESDESGRFWVMNYFYPGDTHLKVDQDELVLRYGEGETHARSQQVERIIQLQIDQAGITRIDQPPIYLKLLEKDKARNWEGIVLLDDLGFLLITDRFPDSLIGFCPFLR